MSHAKDGRRRKTAKPLTFVERIEGDPSHHLAGPFRPQTPLGQGFPPSSQSPVPGPGHPSRRPPVARWSTKSRGFWNDLASFRWVVVPTSSLKLLLFVVMLWCNWELLAPYVAKDVPNPFRPLLFISHRVPSSPDSDPRYQKGYSDLAFIGYYIIFWSFVRQTITIHLCKPVARHYGIRKEAKLDRFGEQGYAVIYWGFMAAWGARIMSQHPTWWYRTEYFWIDYPHWDMRLELKAYYLLQIAYWCQQFIVLALGLEKPRKDYYELVAHHLVTLWLVGWSYLVNLTLIGNAVYLSMDFPDSAFALSKLFNYLQMEKSKRVMFVVFLGIWTYFRHWLNWTILYSVWFEFDLMPEISKRWSPEDGVWMPGWMKYQVFIPLTLLQLLNLFWYALIWRVAWRVATAQEVTDVRSDDEDDGDDKDD